MKLIIFLILISSQAFALPIDWNGQLSFDYNAIADIRKTSNECTVGNGSECIANGDQNARFQTYNLRLNPSLIVNDSATIKGELSTGDIRGGYLGANNQWDDTAAASYYNISPNGSNSLNVNQLYVELYADTALYRVGKFSKHFGLGAVINDGSNSFDRFFTKFDGIEAEFKIGNFTATPSYAKIYTQGQRPTGRYDVIETAIKGVYDNPNSNLQFGVYYGNRETQSQSDFYAPESKPASQGAQAANLVDIFIKQDWEKASVAIEIPMLTGKVENIYNGASNASFDANAVILNTHYELNESWKVGFDYGQVKGDDGMSDSAEAMYLHPNFQVARLLFRYDYDGFNDAEENIFQSSIVNTSFVKLYTDYRTSNWLLNISYIAASANQVASSGKNFLDHDKKEIILATEDQDADLGYEIDFNFEYTWNPSITVSGYIAQHWVGAFYEFDNNPTTSISTTNPLSYGFGLNIKF